MNNGDEMIVFARAMVPAERHARGPDGACLEDCDGCVRAMEIAADLRGHGAAWLRSNLGVAPSHFGARVANLLSVLVQGIYHIDTDDLRVADWTSAHTIAIRWYGELASCDAPLLTRLVVLAHDRAIRVAVRPRANRHLTLSFSPRRATDTDLMDGHPCLETGIARARKRGG